jgi:hypothetical protein
MAGGFVNSVAVCSGDCCNRVCWYELTSATRSAADTAFPPLRLCLRWTTCLRSTDATYALHAAQPVVGLCMTVGFLRGLSSSAMFLDALLYYLPALQDASSSGGDVFSGYSFVANAP